MVVVECYPASVAWLLKVSHVQLLSLGLLMVSMHEKFGSIKRPPPSLPATTPAFLAFAHVQPAMIAKTESYLLRT